MKSTTQLIHLTINRDLIKALDGQAKISFVTRSEFIRQAIVERVLQCQYPDKRSQQALGALHLLTDRQLQETRDAAMLEIRRRRNAVYQ